MWEETMHERQVCKHGVLVSQCRCPGPKVDTVVPCPPECKECADEARV